MSDRRTARPGVDVTAYLDAVPDPGRREDARAVTLLMRDVTGAEPEMWSGSIIGFGRLRHPATEGGEETFTVGLAPHRGALTLYGLTASGRAADLLARLGRHSTERGHLHVASLGDVDAAALRDLVARAWETSTAVGG